jgi:hypothetical protein
MKMQQYMPWRKIPSNLFSFVDIFVYKPAGAPYNLAFRTESSLPTLRRAVVFSWSAGTGESFF